MIFVALLRGINVGGKNKVEMAKLKQTFEKLGFTEVRTYINSGNVMFVSSKQPSAGMIEAAIEKGFGFPVPTLVRSLSDMETIVKRIPNAWVNDDQMKCDVMFLWKGLDSPTVLEQIAYKPELEDVLYVPGALAWRIDRANVNRGSLFNIVGTDVYRQMTIRNVNTVRKLYELMKA